MKEKYLKENALSRATHKAYSKDVPQFLHGNTKIFLHYCLKRWGLVEEHKVLMSTYGFRMRQYTCILNMNIPNQLSRFQNFWPALAVMKFYPAYGWEFMLELYTRMPCFYLDDSEPLFAEQMDNIHSPTSIRKTHLKECVELLSLLTSFVHCV